MLISISSSSPSPCWHPLHLICAAASHSAFSCSPITPYMACSLTDFLQLVQQSARGLNLSDTQKGQLSLLVIQAFKQVEWQVWPQRVMMWHPDSRQIEQACQPSMQQGKDYSMLQSWRFTAEIGARLAQWAVWLVRSVLRWASQVQEQMHLTTQKARGAQTTRMITIVLNLQASLVEGLLERSQFTVFPLYLRPQQTYLHLSEAVALMRQLVRMVSGSLKQSSQVLEQKKVVQHLAVASSTRASWTKSTSSKCLKLVEVLEYQ